MKTALELLSQTQVASPCSADWNEMAGDEFSRFCDHCSKNVYNLSALTAEAAINLIREKEGNLCGRFFRRADGTMLTADCPIGLHHRLRRKRKLAVLAASVFGLFGFSGCAKFDDASNSTTAEPPAQQAGSNQQQQPVNVVQPMPAVAGGICAPPELLLRQGVAEQLPAPREVELQGAIDGR